MHLAAEHIVAVHGLGGDEVGRDDHIVNIIFVHKFRHTVAPVFAVVDGVDMVVILGQEGHIAVAEGVLDHQTVGRVRDALVDHMGQSAVRGQEGGIAGILVHVPGLFRDQRPFGSLGAVRKVGVEGDVSLGHIAVQRIGTQLLGPANLAVQGAGELALIPQGEGVQRRGLLACGFAHGLVGVVGARWVLHRLYPSRDREKKPYRKIKLEKTICSTPNPKMIACRANGSTIIYFTSEKPESQCAGAK